MHLPVIFPILALWIVVGGLLLLTRSLNAKLLIQKAIEAKTGLALGAEGTRGGKNAKKGEKKSSTSSGARANNDSDAAKVNSAQQFMQCAIDQQAQAETALSRTHYGDRNSRLCAASEAQCHADSARNWADRSNSIAYGASALAQNAAAKARIAANKAQESANRARYNADTCKA